MSLRKGPPPTNTITLLRHRLAVGEDIETIAGSLGYRAETLAKYSGRPEVHPATASATIRVTTPGGAIIEGLSLTELIRLARSL